MLFSNLLIELNCLLQRYRLLKRKTLESHLKKASQHSRRLIEEQAEAKSIFSAALHHSSPQHYKGFEK